MLARLRVGHLPLCYETRRFGSSILALLLVGSALGCRASTETNLAPKPYWAVSLGAGKEARLIDAAWRSGGTVERATTEPLLGRFLERYPSDPRATGMKLRLGWLRMEQQRYDEAAVLLASSRLVATGVDADWVVALTAALMHRKGNPQAALEAMLTLDGKIVDLSLFPLWSEQAVFSALAAARVRTALDLMIQWLAYDAEEQQQLTRSRIESLLAQIESLKLAMEFDRLTQMAKAPVAEASLLQARQWMLESVRGRLATDALDRKDAALARRLIATAQSKFQRSELGERLRQLADRSLPPEPMMQASIGLLLETHDNVASRRSAELVTGAMRALAERDAAFPVRLLSREVNSKSPTDAAAALSALFEDGAAIVIAGVTAATDEPARALAQTRLGVVVTLTTRDADPASGPYLFRVEEAARVADRQFPSSERGGPLRLLPQDPLCLSGRDPAMVQARPGRRNWLVLTDENCAGRLAAELPPNGELSAIWLGPEAAPAAARYPHAFVMCSPQLVEVSSSDKVRQWQSRFQRLPFWYEALGYDVASLGVEALRQVGAQSVTGVGAIGKVRAEVAAALERATAELMTSQATGFTHERRLVPSLVITPRASAESSSVRP